MFIQRNLEVKKKIQEETSAHNVEREERHSKNIEEMRVQKLKKDNENEIRNLKKYEGIVRYSLIFNKTFEQFRCLKEEKMNMNY